MHESSRTRAAVASSVARTMLAMATVGAFLFIGACAPPRDRGVPVRIGTSSGSTDGPITSGVPVRISIAPEDIGSGEEASVELKLDSTAGLSGQWVAVFYSGATGLRDEDDNDRHHSRGPRA